MEREGGKRMINRARRGVREVRSCLHRVNKALYRATAETTRLKSVIDVRPVYWVVSLSLPLSQSLCLLSLSLYCFVEFVLFLAINGAIYSTER